MKMRKVIMGRENSALQRNSSINELGPGGGGGGWAGKAGEEVGQWCWLGKDHVITSELP